LITLSSQVVVVAEMEMQISGFMVVVVLVALGQLLQPQAAVVLWKQV
jgi:hypothetical protein